MVLVRYEGGAREKAGTVCGGWVAKCLSSRDCILQTRGEAAVGIERREWPVTIGGREIQLWTWTTWMGGACRVSWGECASFCDHRSTMFKGNKRENLDFQIPNLGPGRCELLK